MSDRETPHAVAEAFYTAMASRDHAAMGALYDDAATFRDPAFGQLDARSARAMWAMLLSRSKDISVTYEILSSDGDSAQTRWVARYTFGKTGRPVTNVITAVMDVRDGKIVRHVDQFDMRAWMRQALGWPAILFGWLPAFQQKVTGGAQAQLKAFMERQSVV